MELQKENVANSTYQRYLEHEVRIQLVRDSDPKTEYRINEAIDAYNLVKEHLTALDREMFVVASIDTRNKLLGLHMVSLGTLNQNLVHPREVFKTPILLNASRLILFHNHPSGNSDPSDNDIKITKRLCEVGKLIGIPIIDHIIVGQNRFYSFSDNDILV